MADTRTKEQRRRIMQAVKTRDTKPEIAIRRALHRAGYRYRLYTRTLPGKPDLVFPGRRKVIFVHGCFWHGHNCRIGKLPKSRLDYWETKITTNRCRDEEKRNQLESMGWNVLVIWQCEINDLPDALRKAKKFLGRPKIRSTTATL